ncbi:MAG: hypothetical protein DME26_12550 [Verrucomicrobia bacterium]|nr:MAG: hypothetical protein DME26_12550 [Verrucomicrobiota bacterium]
MLAELDCVTLKVALPEHGLAAGDVGTVVHSYKDRRSFMEIGRNLAAVLRLAIIAS